jgi:hypothetical protein
MAHVNLMYRERADVECDDLTARADDRMTADRWVDVCLQVKKQKAENSRALEKLATPTAQ